jgi:hypothetical protein
MQEFEEKFKNLFLYKKGERFGITELIESVVGNANDTDLFIIDHVHYFDLDDENENKAMADIAKTVRRLSIDEGKPIILVAHLRKRDRNNSELVADLDEFHGSSNLAKIATRVITFASGEMTEKGKFETFVRVPKNRVNSECKRFIARMIFNPQKGCYEDEYQLGYSNCTRERGFQAIQRTDAPEWARQMAPPTVVSINNRNTKKHWADTD